MQNRKREMEMDRERKQKDQQLAVFKQKYAEATQITKRLQVWGKIDTLKILPFWKNFVHFFC